MRRTLLVGDIHGCVSELKALLSRLQFSEADRLVCVGDLVARGPDSVGVLAHLRELGARAVRGNHEDKLLAWRRRTSRGEKEKLGPLHLEVAEALDASAWAFLESLPLSIALPEHDLVVVHAGVVPGLSLAKQPRHALLTMRSLDASGRPSKEDLGRPWGATYEGPPHVVFGHYARPAPQFHAWATGIDTGCVYGGALTALVLQEGECLPRGAAVSRHLVSERAAKRYYEGTLGWKVPFG